MSSLPRELSDSLDDSIRNSPNNSTLEPMDFDDDSGELTEVSGMSEEEERELSKKVASDILAGFDKHYRLFRYCAQQAKKLFEDGDWHLIQQLARDRIDFYDERVKEAVDLLRRNYGAPLMAESIWQKVKTRFVTYLVDHKQPELAETFFNSVITKILHRDYYHNRFLFVRPAVSTEYVESDPPSYRCYYPANPESGGLRKTLKRMISDFGLNAEFVDLNRDIRYMAFAARQVIPRPIKIDQDCQIQVLGSLFFRNKGAYIIGKFMNGNLPLPFAIPILRDSNGRLYIDTMLFNVQQIATLFSFTRAYFLVDMETPGAYVQFLRTLLPNKPKAEMYTMLGLHKQGKTLFYRDFLHHLKHSHDNFIVAPGIKGLVMAVFTLPSYPYVFKLIKDKIAPSKEIDCAGVMKKYQLVKEHDRVGRMADTWEYSHVSLPRNRFCQELIDHLVDTCESSLTFEGDMITIKHVYIERRMTPLNIYLHTGTDAEVEHGIIEYGNAIKQLAAANIFPGDMLFKNFGVTRLGRVVFYDYDEIEYMTDCNFRKIPEAPNPEAEMSHEPWYRVEPKDVFPEEFGQFLLGDRRVRKAFLAKHRDLLEYEFWQERKVRIQQGHIEDIFPYSEAVRFTNRFKRARA
jgi:isocitrate dehydrogenase kinase/phosphatase